MQKCEENINKQSVLKDQQRKAPQQPCFSKFTRMVVDLFQCDRQLIQSEHPKGQNIYADNFDRVLKDNNQPIVFNENNKQKFRPMPKHNWYSLAGIKQMLLCLSPEQQDEQARSTLSQKANLVQYTQQDLLGKGNPNESLSDHFYNEKQEIFNQPPVLKLKTSKDAPKTQHLLLQKIKEVQQRSVKTTKDQLQTKQLDPKQIEVKNRAARKLLQQQKAAKFFTDIDPSSNHSTANILVNENSQTPQINVDQPLIYFEDVVEDMSEYSYQESPDRRKTKGDLMIKQIPPMSSIVYEKEVNNVVEINPEASKELATIDPPQMMQTIEEKDPQELKFTNVVSQGHGSPDPLRFEENVFSIQQQPPQVNPVQEPLEIIQFENAVDEPVLVYKFQDNKPKEKGKGKKKKTRKMNANYEQQIEMPEKSVQITNVFQPETEEKQEVEITSDNEQNKQQDTTIQLSMADNPRRKKKGRMSKLTFLTEDIDLNQFS